MYSYQGNTPMCLHTCRANKPEQKQNIQAHHAIDLNIFPTSLVMGIVLGACVVQHSAGLLRKRRKQSATMASATQQHLQHMAIKSKRRSCIKKKTRFLLLLSALCGCFWGAHFRKYPPHRQQIVPGDGL